MFYFPKSYPLSLFFPLSFPFPSFYFPHSSSSTSSASCSIRLLLLPLLCVLLPFHYHAVFFPSPLRVSPLPLFFLSAAARFLSFSSSQKGNLDEINNHFSNFHSYRPPNYSEEVWEQVSADDVYLVGRDGNVSAHPAEAEREALMVPCDPPPMQLPPLAAGAAYHHHHHQQGTATPASFVQSLSPYCLAPPPGNAPLSPWAEVVALPGSDYSAMVPLSSAAPEAAKAHCATAHQDFYTCVQLMNESGEVHLVPCLPPAYCRDFPPPQLLSAQEEEEEEKKRKKQVEHQARKSEDERSLSVS